MKVANVLNQKSDPRRPVVVVDQDGVECATASPYAPDPQGKAQMLISFNHGKQFIVPKELLQRQTDGHYRLVPSVEELMSQYRQAESEVVSGNLFPSTATSEVKQVAEQKEFVVPVTEEQIVIRTEVSETGRVYIQKSVEERTEKVDTPLIVEEVIVERVPINRALQEMVAPRYEGDTFIIPLVEEVLVVQKQLVLREEIHVVKVRREVHQPQEVRLRTEEVKISRHPTVEKHSK
jgi:uncharacterized protein (TIGR02271 family)